MPVVGTVDVAVHLHRVHNIDLFCRGVYYLRTSLVLPAKVTGGDAINIPPRNDGGNGGGGGGNNGGANGEGGNSGAFKPEELDAQGIPYMCLAQCTEVGTSVGHKKVPPMPESRLQGPAVHGHCYHSRMFIIRYRDEELELGEVVNFQIPVELDAGRRWLEAGQKLVLQMELMFSKLSSLERDTPLPSNGADKSRGDNYADGTTGDSDSSEDVLELEPVAVQRFEASLSGGHWGIHAYVPVTFSGVHFVRVDCMVHGVLRNLRLEPPPRPRPPVNEGAASGGRKGGADSDRSTGNLTPSNGRSREEREGTMVASGQRLGHTKNKPPKKKYTWFSLYDDQRREIERARRFSGSDWMLSASGAVDNASADRSGRPDIARLLGVGGNINPTGASSNRDARNNAKGRQVGVGWRWGWGRKPIGGGRGDIAGASSSTEDTGFDKREPRRRRAASVDEKMPLIERQQGDSSGIIRSSASNGTDDRSGRIDRRGRKEGRQQRAAIAFAPGEKGRRRDNQGNEVEVDSVGGEGGVPGAVEVGLGGVGKGAEGVGGDLPGRGDGRDKGSPAQKKRRKEVYSYFVMALVRALEAQAGTTSWLKRLLESEVNRGEQQIPVSAEQLWGPPEESSGRDVMRVLGRLFASEADVSGRSTTKDTGKVVASAMANENGASPEVEGSEGTAQKNESGGPKGGDVLSSAGPGEGGGSDVVGVGGRNAAVLPAMASVAYPSLISRYCSGLCGGEGRGGSGVSGSEAEASWLDDDSITCKALEQDIHCLAMIIFVEWREFVSALPGCGKVLSRETSALWLAQLRQRWACQTTLHTCSTLQTRPHGILPPTGTPRVKGSAMRAPRLSRLEPDIGSDSFGIALRMACADASAPYKLPLQDQHMFPEPEALLPVCLVQRFSTPPELKQGRRAAGRPGMIVVDTRVPGEHGPGSTMDAQSTPITSPVIVPTSGSKSSAIPDASTKRGNNSPKAAAVGRATGTAERTPFYSAPPPRGAESLSPRSRRVPPKEALEVFTATFAPPPVMGLAKSSGDSSPDSSTVSSPTRPTNFSVTPTRRGRSTVITDRRSGHGPVLEGEPEAIPRRDLSPPMSPLALDANNGGDNADHLRDSKSNTILPPFRVNGPPATPPSSGRSLAKNSRSLSPFFGNRTMVFLSPISKRRARAQWMARSIVSGEAGASGGRGGGGGGGGGAGGGKMTVSKKTGRVLKRSTSAMALSRTHLRTRSDGGIRISGWNAVGQAPRFSVQIQDSPIVVPEGRRLSPSPAGGSRGTGVGRSSKSPPPPRMLPLASAFARSSGQPVSQAAVATTTPLMPPTPTSTSTLIPTPPPPPLLAQDLLSPPPTRQGVSSPRTGGSTPRRRSLSISPRRPPPKQMTEVGPRTTDGYNGGNGEKLDGSSGLGSGSGGSVSGTVSGSVTSRESVQPEDARTVSNASAKPKMSRAKSEMSLLDGVEQSSDLGTFFRRGEGHGLESKANPRRQRRMSPVKSISRGGRGGGGGGRGDTGKGGDTRVSGYFAGGAMSRSNATWQSPNKTEGKSSNDDGANRDVEDDDNEEDDEEEEEAGHGSGKGVHVIVLHHGYCGSSMDMRLIKNYIRILAPDALVLNAESNERDQHTSMKTMGENLAKEIHRFLMIRAPSVLIPGGQGRLSFLAHSAGAIIVRIALTSKVLRPALKCLHLFVSLGSPHLGTLYGASGLVRTGMWAMKRWTKSQLLEEIGMTDASHPRDSLLCWLSRQPGLEYFRHVVLVSADKDGYVPPQSARVQMCDAAIRDARRGVAHGQIVCDMAQSVLGPISDETLYRLHLWGGGRQAAGGGGGGMDEYIGRAAHISMMDSPSLVCLLLCTLLDLIR